MGRIRVFVSHSSQDTEIAATLVSLLRAALSLPADQIRCTSLDGYRLPAGATVDERLKAEVHDADAFIGLISRSSLSSAYVLFELGARWGASRHLAPLLVAGLEPSFLAPPLSGLNALTAENEAQVFQLISEIGDTLEVSSGHPGTYSTEVRSVVEASIRQGKSQAAVVLVLDGNMTGEMYNQLTGERQSFFVFPVRLVNESPRPITFEYFTLTVWIDGKAHAFIQNRIPRDVTWGSSAQTISLPNADQHDLAVLAKSVMPGEAVVGYLMFSSREVPLSAIQRVGLLPMQFGCTDIRGQMHPIAHVYQPASLPGVKPRLNIVTEPKQQESDA